MRERRVVMVETGKRLARRHSHSVGDGFVIGGVVLMPEPGRDGGEEAIERIVSPGGFDQLERCGRMEMGGQPIDLVGVEHRISFEHTARLFAALPALGGFDVFGVALVENRDRGLFAHAHLAAVGVGLGIGHPVRRGVPGHVGDHPQPEHVHAAVGRAAAAQRA